MTDEKRVWLSGGGRVLAMIAEAARRTKQHWYDLLDTREDGEGDQ